MNRVYIAVNADTWGISDFSVAEAVAQAYRRWVDRVKVASAHNEPRLRDHYLFRFEGQVTDFLGFDYSDARSDHDVPRLVTRTNAEVLILDPEELGQCKFVRRFYTMQNVPCSPEKRAELEKWAQGWQSALTK